MHADQYGPGKQLVDKHHGGFVKHLGASKAIPSSDLKVKG